MRWAETHSGQSGIEVLLCSKLLFPMKSDAKSELCINSKEKSNQGQRNRVHGLKTLAEV
jgi:hypothetical protein